MTKEELKNYLEQTFAGKITHLESGKYDLMYQLNAEDLVSFCKALRDDEKLQFNYFCNLGGSDTGEQLEAVYQIASTVFNIRLDFKVILPRENAEIDSVQEIWPASNWYEREMWELYGINVKNHGNLTRFLLPDDWDEGHPMLKGWDAPDFIRMPEL